MGSMLIGAVLLSLQHGVQAADQPRPDQAVEKYRDLIQRLVSPNQEPLTQNRSAGAVKFPEGYDVEAQKRIDVARQSLRDDFERALPFLIDALKDDRYSMTIDWGEGDACYNYSVGGICGNVIASQLEVYRNRMGFSGPRHWHQYSYPTTKEWFETRKNRNLAELQVEAIDWAMERRKNEGKGEAVVKDLAELQKLRDAIAVTRKPAPPLRMYPMVTKDRGRIR
jgi:hypothetical protein